MNLSVSVVMAVRNGLRFLPMQVHSVLTQLHDGDELIAVDDASTDGSTAWLEALSDPRIRIRRQVRNCGVRETFAHGLALARLPIVFLCDQDDVWLPGKRDAFVEAFASDERVTVVVSDAEVVDADGRVTAPSFMALRGGFASGLWSTLYKNRYLGCSMAVRRSVLNIALPIPKHVPMHDMWLGVVGAACGRVRFLPYCLMQYRRHGSNATALDRSPYWRKALHHKIALLGAAVPRLAHVWRRRLSRRFAECQSRRRRRRFPASH